MNQKYTNDTMLLYYKDFDENLAWLTQNTKESPPPPTHTHTHTHTVNAIEL